MSMETLSSRTARPDLARTDSSGGTPGGGIVDAKLNMHAGPSAHRSIKYKEKFHTLRDKYETVMTAHERLERDLAIANGKIEDLQNECNLLLDAVDIAVPGQPTLQRYLNYDPVPAYMASAPSTYMNAPPAVPEHLQQSQQSQQQHAPSREPSPPPGANGSRSDSRNGAPVAHTNGVNGH